MMAITESQLSGWLEWVKVRGPIGGPRQDWYHSNLTMHAGKPYPDGESVSESDFWPYWAKLSEKLAKEITAEAEAAQNEE